MGLLFLSVMMRKREKKMKLYHTSDRIIEKPDIHYGRKNADFGQGFYLTPDREFTLRWAGKDAIVNTYELDETGLRIHRFERSLEWYRYLFMNRRRMDTLDADVIIGPIANDTIFDTMGIISSGFLNEEEALKLLRIGPEYIQAAVKTERAAAQLHFLGSKKINRLDETSRRKEEEAYQNEFSAVMMEISEE